jgi:hypothetical protein
MNVEFRDTGSLCESAIALPQVIAPFGKNVTFLLVLHEMPYLAVGGEEPVLGPFRVGHSPKSDRSHDAASHRPRQRNVERLLLAPL